MASTEVSGGGIGFVGLLTITFIVLKLTNQITWSWVWVLSPVWISALILILLMITLAVVITYDHKKYK